MGAGIGAIGDTVAVDVEIPAKVAAVLEHLRRHHLAAVVLAGIVPLQRAAEPVVHANIEIEHDKNRGLQPLGEVEGGGCEFERLGRILREQQHMLGVAMGSIGAGEDVALLGAGRHAGRWAGALHVHDHGRDLGEVGEADEFLHQGDAGAGGGGEGARAVP
ncbi:hypothetical protein GALL_524670 [mine drainage metagenome]|uniref:Uncharacterized protein n=1 Tax=mine drainage metagenome TaxID=410659 RepID=A0A1J5P4C4_9ZZZZ